MMAETEMANQDLTEPQLMALFAAHCECRPLDIDRAEREHSHDCDTGILDDIQTASNATDAEEQGAAMFRCAEQWAASSASAIYSARLVEALEHPPMTIQEWNRQP